MKNRTDLVLLCVFWIGALIYGILLVTFIQYGGTATASPVAYALSRVHLWFAASGHAVPFFALQLLLCRMTAGKKFPALLLTLLVVGLLAVCGVAFLSATGWDKLGWGIFLIASIAPVVGCVLAWVVYGFAYLYQRAKHDSPPRNP